MSPDAHVTGLSKDTMFTPALSGAAAPLLGAPPLSAHRGAQPFSLECVRVDTRGPLHWGLSCSSKTKAEKMH